MTFHAYSDQKRTGVALPTLDKIDFRFFKKLIRDEEGHYVLTKRFSRAKRCNNYKHLHT